MEFEISHLSFSEYLGMKQFFGKPVDPDPDAEFIHYIREGGFPLAVKFDSQQDKKTYIESVIKEIYEKDIRKNKKIRKKQLFDKLMTYMINNLLARRPPSNPYARRYPTRKASRSEKRLSITTFRSFRMQGLSANAAASRYEEQEVAERRRKYYLSDLSFSFRNTDNRINYGPVLENIVYNYAKSRGYSVSVGRIGKLEVDFPILRDVDTNYCYIQVARTIDNDNYDEDGKHHRRRESTGR